MKTMSALKATATIGAAIVLALLTVQGTLASWSASTTSTSQVVQAADFAMTAAVGDGGPQPLPAGGVLRVPVPTGLKPWTSKVTPIVVTNDTNAGGAFTIRATATATVPADGGQLAPYLVTGLGAGKGGSCAAIDQVTTVVLDKGASATFCLSTSLKADTPVAMGGTGASIALTLDTQQQPR
jgi:predicted ribosomally synthesized peptide with SipW-like signal peptide